MSFDRNYKDSRILVTGGAGFLGSHLCDRLIDDGRWCCASTIFSRAHGDNIAQLLEQPAVRADAPRRDISAVRGGGRDLQSGVPGFADSLSARSRADDQDQRAWRHQHARARQAAAGQDPAGIDLRGVWRSRPCIRSPRNIGATSIRSAARSCYDEGKRCAETLFFDYHRQHKLRIKVARIFNTYGPRMHPERRARRFQLHRAGAARASRSRFTAMARQTRVVLLCRRPRRRLRALMERRRGHGSDQYRQQLSPLGISLPRK